MLTRRSFLFASVPLVAGCAGGNQTQSLINQGDDGGRQVITPPESIPLTGADPTLEPAELRLALQAQSSLNASDRGLITYFDGGACRRWNNTARGLVAEYKTPPPKAARAYALLSIAQYDTLLATQHYQKLYPRQAPYALDVNIKLLVTAPSQRTAFPDSHAAVAHASAAILKALYSDSATTLNELRDRHTLSRMQAGVCLPSDGDAGAKIGQEVARRVLEYTATDGSNAVWNGILRTGSDVWYPDNGTGLKPPPAVLPLWGQVRPWFITDLDALRPPPPPAEGSPEFLTNLTEVRRISDTRTAEQLTIARKWAYGPGTATPPGAWNEIALGMAQQYNLSELRTARMLCLLNRALLDASIACWDTKYHYWTRRPSQVDSKITLPIGLPNFPSYTSGHSTFSGAAAILLSYLFPAQAASLNTMVEEASISRIYGGIHFRHDCEQGTDPGKKNRSTCY